MRLSTPLRGFLAAAALLLILPAAQAQSYATFLSGANERPDPNTSTATGSFAATLTGTTLVVTGSFSGLGSDYTMSHLHIGGAEASGPVFFGLTPTLSADKRSATYSAAQNTTTLTADQVTALKSNGVYVNVHSATFGGGEIRGQLATSIAQARADAAAAPMSAATVTVTGVVSRAKGAFTQIQDASMAGITIRQTNGMFFDAVASGQIASGRTVTITGKTSSFNGLLQINGADLTSFTVGAQGAALAAQTVTLAQLANGEQYESELVRVVGVTIPGAGAVFTERTNYDVTDATGTAVLRVVNASDTDVDGVVIPAPATVTAVVSQFDSANLATGGGSYQLQPINATDVVATSTTATAETPGGRLSLAVANPLRGVATVRFSTETAQMVRVALVDALGRTVRTLAEGTSVGARTASLDAAGLAPGVYVLRLTAGEGQLSQTVTVVR